MRLFHVPTLSLFLAFPAVGQQRAARLMPAPKQEPQTQQQLIEKRATKLAKPVFQKAAWTFDFATAKKLAREKDQLILVYFTRSYAY